MMRLFLIVAFSVLPLQISCAAVCGQSTANDRTSFGGRSAEAFSLSYAPTSSHILVGLAQSRRTTQAAWGYEHALLSRNLLNISYEGSIVPLFLESDVTVKGASAPNVSGPPTVVYGDPVRVLSVNEPLYYINIGTLPNTYLVPVTPIAGPRQTTYAFAALPVGVRLNGIARRRIQPTFAVNLGALYATRNIPVDNTSSFNFLGYAGPGLEVFLSRKRSIRVEYVYEHLSNANLGNTNPGVDSATFRMTLSHYR